MSSQLRTQFLNYMTPHRFQTRLSPIALGSFLLATFPSALGRILSSRAVVLTGGLRRAFGLLGRGLFGCGVFLILAVVIGWVRVFRLL